MVDTRFELAGIVVGLDDHRQHLLGRERLGDAVNHGRDKRVGKVGHDHADCAGHASPSLSVIQQVVEVVLLIYYIT